MLQDHQPKEEQNLFRFDLTLIQKYLLRALFFLLPLAIFPFPWEWTERSMSLLLLSVATIIIGLEIIKLFWHGKVNFLKSSMDIGFFLILLSMLISTMFSVDFNTSLWGIDGRFGGGLIVFIAILLVTIVSRGFIDDEKDIRFLIMSFLIGFFINNVLSLLSFFGFNIWAIVPVYRDLHQGGLPLFRSAKIHLLVNVVSVILCIGFIGEYLINGKRKIEYILSLVLGFFSIVNIWLFSINQSLALTLSLLAIVIVLVFLVLKTLRLDKETSKQVLLFSLICVFLIAIPVIFLQIPRVTEALLGENFEMITEISLGFDISWVIGGSVLVSNFIAALFGLGPATYSVAYNMFKPYDFGLLALGDTTFHRGMNEVLTGLTTGGLVWLLIWFFLGYIIIRNFIQDLKNANVSPDKGGIWWFLLVDVLILTIYLSSFLTPYSVIVLFLLLAFVSIRSVIRENLHKTAEDKFLIKFWALSMSSKPDSKNSLYSFNVFLTVVVSIFAFVLLGLWGARTIASFNVLRAEAYMVSANRKFVDDPTLEVTMEEREEFVLNMGLFYSRALNLDRRNPLYNRKAAVIVLEEIGILVDFFAEVDEEDTELREQYINAIMALKSEAINFSRESTDISPSIYANWVTRASVYSGLVGIGLNEHISDSLTSLERAVNLNPLNFQLYYNIAQIHIIREEAEIAFQFLSRALEINPQHLPSILLVADLSREEGNIELYAAYLQAAQQILEFEEATELEIYNEIVLALQALEDEGFNLEETPDLEFGESELEDIGLEELDLPGFEEQGPFEIDQEGNFITD